MRVLPTTLMLSLCSSHAFAGDPPELFSKIFSASQPTPPRTQAAFPATVNFQALNANPASISIELPGAGTFVANRERLEQMPGGGYHWIGKTTIHDVVLTVKNDIITGFIRGGPDTFSILGDGDPTVSLQRMDAAAFPDDIVLEEEIQAKGATPAAADRVCFGKDFQPIDVLLVYSPQALTASGGDPQVMENELNNAIAAANVTLWNSDVPTFFNAVSIEPAPVSLVEFGIINDLDVALLNDDLIQRRHDTGADIVTYITSIGMQGSNPYCGVARTQRRSGNAFFGIGYDFYPNAMQVVTWQCGVQNNDISHEIGHNAGLDHNPPVFATRPPAENLYGYGYGHEVNGLFRDDMSGINANICPDGCPRQMFFSDPGVDFVPGVPRGTVAKNNAHAYRRSFRCLNTFAEFILVDGFE